METPELYIPIDRRVAMARGQSLPERSQGAALFADISGFTPLTDALVRSLGPQRGAEELPRQLNRVYDALIAEVDRWGGSVIGFSGDAITCWFDGDIGLRAITAAAAMQQAMAQFATVQIPDGTTVALAVKIAVATGPVRRFVVGDPSMQLVDVVAGATLERLAAAEHQAAKGEVVVAAGLDAAVEQQLLVDEQRTDPETGQRYLVVAGVHEPVAPQPWPAAAEPMLGAEQARPWVLPPVHARLASGLGEFLTELRPAVALFVRFGSIDYDQDADACAKLDAYIRWVQSVLVRYGGYLIQLTVGDKGSYLYAAFGAPIAHDDDAARAIKAGLELRTPPLELPFITSVQIGVSRGRMRTGAYGGTTARTYGVLGPETNMAARLMQHAPAGEVLVSLAAQREAATDFVWEVLPPLRVKGKVEPATVFRLVGADARSYVHLQEPRYGLPMVGRNRELAQIALQMEQARAGTGQITGITAEAGMGKSRLVAETMRLAQSRSLAVYAGECQSYGTNISYLAWRPIWQALLGVDVDRPPEEQIAQVEQQLAAIDARLVARAPLLGVVLNLPIPDNDLTRSLDAKLRKASLEALLVDCVRGAVVNERWSVVGEGAGSGARGPAGAEGAGEPGRAGRAQAALFVLEDCHWIDPLSHDLLEAIGRSISDLPVHIVAAYRPPEIERLQAPRVMTLPYAQQIALTDFSPAEAARLIELKLGQLTGDTAVLAPAFVERITARAQGNPFYIEELVNYLHDRNIAVGDLRALDELELPTSLQSLILSRIDQLSEHQKLTLRVASVIGRQFHFSWLWGVHPPLGLADRVRDDLDALSRIDLTPLDQPEPELTYLFKHIVTREVAYESLPYALRTVMHGQLGGFIEASYGDALDQYVDLLAYHFDHSENLAKKREYLGKAGAAAQAAYANDAAISYYERLLPLLHEPADRQQTHAKLGHVLATIGAYDQALVHLDASLELAARDADAQAHVCRWIAYVHEFRGEYQESLRWIERGLAALGTLETATTAELLAIAGLINTRLGDYETAQQHCERCIAIAESLDNAGSLAFAHNARAIVALGRGHTVGAIEHFKRAAQIYESTDNIHGLGMSSNGIGNTYSDMGQLHDAAAYLRKAHDIFVQTGDKLHQLFADNNLGGIALKQGRLDDALNYYQGALEAVEQVGGAAYVTGAIHLNLGATFSRRHDHDTAHHHLQLSEQYFAQANTRDFLSELYRLFAETALRSEALESAAGYARQALDIARELQMRGEEGSSLRVLGNIASARGELDQAAAFLDESLAVLLEVQYEYEVARTQLARAQVYLRQGQFEQGLVLGQAAAEVFVRLGATLDLAEADALQQQFNRTVG